MRIYGRLIVKHRQDWEKWRKSSLHGNVPGYSLTIFPMARKYCQKVIGPMMQLDVCVICRLINKSNFDLERWCIYTNLHDPGVQFHSDICGYKLSQGFRRILFSSFPSSSAYFESLSRYSPPGLIPYVVNVTNGFLYDQYRVTYVTNCMVRPRVHRTCQYLTDLSGTETILTQSRSHRDNPK